MEPLRPSEQAENAGGDTPSQPDQKARQIRLLTGIPLYQLGVLSRMTGFLSFYSAHYEHRHV